VGKPDYGGPPTPTMSEAAERDRSDLIPAGGVFALFAATVLGGVAMAQPFLGAGLQQFENPSDPGNAALIGVEILVVTAIFLVAFRYELGAMLVRLLVVGVFALALHYPVAVALSALGVGPATPVALVAGLLGGVVLWVFPEWYVIDAAGVLVGATFVAMFGISLGPLPVLALLVGMAAYDAYSVYVSEHMQSLGSGVVDLKLPMVFVVPPDLDFSLREVDDMAAVGERGVALLGLGDAFFPGMLAVSAATFLDAPAVVAGLNLPGLGALVGGFLGMLALLGIVHRVEGAHAGLPPLNGGVLLGYLVGVLAAGVPLVEALGAGPYL
jgi:presenilin-like A22 family membrane protease